MEYLIVKERSTSALCRGCHKHPKITDYACDKCAKLFRTVPQWTKIINLILAKRPGFMQVRTTGHEHRTDNRDITMLDGQSLEFCTIDGLPYNIETDEPIIRKLLTVYDEIVHNLKA